MFPHHGIDQRRVFKYRGVRCLERDLPRLAADNRFAPTAALLNDATEVLCKDIAIARFANSTSSQVAVALRAVTEIRHMVGIYSSGELLQMNKCGRSTQTVTLAIVLSTNLIYSRLSIGINGRGWMSNTRVHLQKSNFANGNGRRSAPSPTTMIACDPQAHVRVGAV